MKKQEAKQDDLTTAHFMGNLPTLPDVPSQPEALVKPHVAERPIDDAHEFEVELSRNKIEGGEGLVISQRLWDFIVKSQKTPFLMYKGVKVYRPGTKDELEKEMGMSAETHHNYMAEKRRNGGLV